MMKGINEAVEVVINHLDKQGCLSMDKHGVSCAYRGTNGNMCAIGVLIDDEHYKTSLESQTPSDDDVVLALTFSGWDFKEEDYRTLSLLQLAHDSVTDKLAFHKGLARNLNQLRLMRHKVVKDFVAKYKPTHGSI